MARALKQHKPILTFWTRIYEDSKLDDDKKTKIFDDLKLALANGDYDLELGESSNFKSANCVLFGSEKLMKGVSESEKAYLKNKKRSNRNEADALQKISQKVLQIEQETQRTENEVKEATQRAIMEIANLKSIAKSLPPFFFHDLNDVLKKKLTPVDVILCEDIHKLMKEGGKVVQSSMMGPHSMFMDYIDPLFNNFNVLFSISSDHDHHVFLQGYCRIDCKFYKYS